ncbi:acetylcholine receptor subunit beta-like [Mya arenaria]|uniref:acetylcholine receptor subunit beta-like n=1 Tax=Mya arenaria TaxID=6604 RepID=UPI0022E93418|nr:acetylcholine receptor subunit beta-like [Mya arenaria]
MDRFVILFAVVLYSSILLNPVSCITSEEMRLHLGNVLPVNYTTYIRPVLDQSTAVAVTVDLHLIGINYFDNQEQKLVTTAYLDIQWTDEVIARNWGDAGNADIEEVYVPQGNVWVPDMALQNGFETMVGLGDSFLYIRIKKDGTVLWRPYQVFESGCEVVITFFPFDKTSCELKLLIWSNTKEKVSLSQGTIGFDTSLYEKNSEWDILKTSTTEVTSGDNSGILFIIEMKRKPLEYLITILVPVIMLGLLNAFLFVLPADSGEKTGYAVTAFLSFAVFLTIISTEMPRNSEDTSMFSLYIFIMTMASTVMVVVTIIQLRIHHRPEERPVSRHFYAITQCVRRIQCAICVGGGHVARDVKRAQEAEEVTWKSVSAAIDFIGFWTFLIFMTVFTATILAVSMLGDKYLQ